MLRRADENPLALHTHTHTHAHTHTKMLRVCVVDSQEVGGKGLYGDEILPFLSKMDVVVMLRGPTFKDTDASLSLSKILETYAGVPMSHMFVRNKTARIARLSQIRPVRSWCAGMRWRTAHFTC